MFGLAAVLGVGAIVIWVLRFGAFAERGGIGLDHTILTEFGRRWLETGSLYLPSQLAGPFAAQPLGLPPAMLPAMYPPLAALLFAPLTVLPWILWWAVPIGLVAFAFARWRPAPWTWPILALMACWPSTSAIVIVGSSSMWITAAVAGGLLWGWPILLVALKPTFAPLLLIGARRWLISSGVVISAVKGRMRSGDWRSGSAEIGTPTRGPLGVKPMQGPVAFLILGAVSLLMIPEWLRYLTVLRNATGVGLFFSIGDLPLVLMPVVAWLGAASGRAPRG